MFNTPILDVAIGLVFIFLLYSLLATSIKEAIATILGLRARMLKKGIVVGMLSNTTENGRLKSVLVFIVEQFKKIKLYFSKSKILAKKSLGDEFYKHPIIKNYGANRFFSLPSYIPNANFSLVLIDVLKDDFNKKISSIASVLFKLQKEVSEEKILQDLKISADSRKIKALLEYYELAYKEGQEIVDPIVESETAKILLIHFRSAEYDLVAFANRLESWFDDSMARVSGWYKRQVQFILFAIGIGMALFFDIDTIQISTRLSKDNELTSHLVTMAIKSSDQYKDDPRVKNALDSNKTVVADSLFNEYNKNMAEVKKTLQGDVSDVNALMALGWGDYGKSDSLFLLSLLTMEKPCWFTQPLKTAVYCNLKEKGKDTLVVKEKASLQELQKVTEVFYAKNTTTIKCWYVLNQLGPKKLLGFLITAFAISLGAPFWFDLLNKLVKVRSAIKPDAKDKGGDSSGGKSVVVHVNGANQEAAG